MSKLLENVILGTHVHSFAEGQKSRTKVTLGKDRSVCSQKINISAP